MIGKHKFVVGQKVKLSKAGKAVNLVYTKHRDRQGAIVKVDEFNTPYVKWDGRKTFSGYHPDYITVIK